MKKKRPVTLTTILSLRKKKTSNTKQKKSSRKAKSAKSYSEMQKERQKKKKQKKPTFEYIFQRRELLHSFRKYLYSKKSQECLQFILEAELYKRLEDINERKKKATTLFNTFLKAGSPSWINVDADIRENIEVAIRKDKFSQNLFAAAYLVMTELLRLECWPKYLESEFFEPLKKKEKQFKPEHKKSGTISNYELLRKLLDSEKGEG